VPTLSSEPVVAIRPEGQWVVGIESHEPCGLADRFRKLPAGATAVIVSWSARGRGWLHYLSGGQLRAGLDPQRPRQRTGDAPGVLDAYLSGLKLPVPGADAAGHLPALLVIAERLTGMRLEPAWLDQPHLLVLLSQGH
jgi:hypothetical protein